MANAEPVPDEPWVDRHSVTCAICEERPAQPPPSIQRFLRRNYPFLTISGVFIALVVYFARLTSNPNEAIIGGMIGGAIMFGIAIAVVLRNVIIGILWSIIYGSLSRTASYFTTFLSLLFITLALIAFFGTYSKVAVDIIDSILAVVILSTLVGISTSMPIQKEEKTESDVIDIQIPIQEGSFASFVFRNSWRISAFILIGAFLASQRFLNLIIIPYLSVYVDFLEQIDMLLFMIILTFIIITIGTLVLALITVATHLSVRFILSGLFYILDIW